MASNENVNKVVYGSDTLIDLTSDTATAADVAAGKTLHLASGAAATGTASYAAAPENNGNATTANGILLGYVNSTSTATDFTATVEGLDALYDGVAVMLHNGIVTSASGFVLNVNGLGDKPVYNNMATGNDITPTNPTRDTTIFNINYTMLFVYDSQLEGGAWICYRGYDANTNTIGYQLRTNSGRKPAADKGYRYRIWLTSADGASWVPINTSTATDATTSRTLNTRKIDPFGPIAYNSTNGTCNAAANLPAATMWRVYTLSIGYSYVKTLTAWDPVYLKCTPQSDGSAVMADIVQALPSSDDGYIYIHLGTAYSTTAMELQAEHPVYWHDGTGIRIWTGAEPESGSTVAVTRSLTSGTKTATLTIDGTGTDLYAPTPPTASTAAPSMDGTAAAGTATTYARADHVHPTDTSKQATLVSGTNIKTVGSQSLLGSGNLTPANIGAAASSHAHGSVTSAGAITSDTTVASGDKLVISDSSDSSKLKRSGIAFGSDTTTFLRNDGTWAAAGGGEVAWDDVTGKPFSSNPEFVLSASDPYKDSYTYVYYFPMGITYDSTGISLLRKVLDGASAPNFTVDINGTSYICTCEVTTTEEEDQGVPYAQRTYFRAATVGGPWTNLEIQLYNNYDNDSWSINVSIAGSDSTPSQISISVYLNGETLNASALPTASTSSLGGVMVGSGLSIDSSGVLSASGGVSMSTATATLPTSGWSSDSITVNVTGVTASNNVIVAPAPASISAWAAAGVYCSAQGAGTLTFTRTSANTAAITVNVLILS